MSSKVVFQCDACGKEGAETSFMRLVITTLDQQSASYRRNGFLFDLCHDCFLIGPTLSTLWERRLNRGSL
jgi:hypothetical protein